MYKVAGDRPRVILARAGAPARIFRHLSQWGNHRLKGIDDRFQAIGSFASLEARLTSRD